jgi:hypothetical protein
MPVDLGHRPVVPVEEPVRIMPHADAGQRPAHHPPVGHDQHTADVEAHGIERREHGPVPVHPPPSRLAGGAGKPAWRHSPDGVDL